MMSNGNGQRVPCRIQFIFHGKGRPDGPGLLALLQYDAWRCVSSRFTRLYSRLCPDDSISIVLTSPPYALHFKKEYGNADKSDYVDWFCNFAREMFRILALGRELSS